MVFFWSLIFATTLIGLVKSADFLVDNSKTIGRFFRLPEFIVGVLVVGVGTSLPELSSSVFAVLQGVPEMVVANAVGSNIANMLLIVGFTAILAKNMTVSKELINLDIPLLLLSTALFLAVAVDGNVSRGDAVFLLAGLLYYITYSIASKSEREKDEHVSKYEFYKSCALFVVSLLVLIISAKYLIMSVVHLGKIFSITPAVLTLFAVAIGTSLPELFVSVSAVKKGKADMALGNIFGSNAFNLLAVVGIPAAFTSLPIDIASLTVAFPLLALSTELFAVSGISRKIHSFEGVFFLIIYAYFVAKVLFGI